IAAAAGAARADGPSQAAPFGPPVGDERIQSHLVVDQLEARLGDDGAALRWQAEAWAGPDEWRVRLRSEGERRADGRVDDGQLEALFEKPVTTYWNLDAGARYDLDSGPGRTWAALGVSGLAPGFVRLAATGYAGRAGLAAKLEASTDLRLTQRLILQPEAEANLYGRADPARRIGAGLSDLDAGLRLRYEITRKFAPYLGLAYERRFCRTADFAHVAGEPAHTLRLALGLRAWL
ncbi:MAG: copper resistance protein B, partial [Caulobacteraceae bacterium]